MGVMATMTGVIIRSADFYSSDTIRDFKSTADSVDVKYFAVNMDLFQTLAVKKILEIGTQ